MEIISIYNSFNKMIRIFLPRQAKLFVNRKCTFGNLLMIDNN